MNIPGIGAVYEAKLSADGNTMAGTIKRGFPVAVPWTPKRVGEDQAWAIPKPPTPAKPMAADAVREPGSLTQSSRDTLTG